MPATFHDNEIKSGLKNKRKLSAFIDALVGRHRTRITTTTLTYIFCTDAYLLGINQAYLDHDTYTDIITFDLSENKEELVGEIYISIDRVKENARDYHTTFTDELHRVIFHGALHLCGFKDKNKKDQAAMRKNEDQCLEQYKQEQER